MKFPNPFKRKTKNPKEAAESAAKTKAKAKAKSGETNQIPGKSTSPAALLAQGSVTIRDIIAPSAIEVDFNHLKIGNTYFRTLFVAGYPRFVSANWLEPLINFDHSLNISMFVYPVEGKSVLDELHRKIAEMEAEIHSDIQRGKIVNPDTKARLEDARSLQEILVKGIERFFQYGLYITIPAKSVEELNEVTNQVVSTLGSLLIVAKATTLEMEKGFKSTLPYAFDYFMVTRNMDTTSLATTFPFTSSELTASEGIMYGLNEHNGSLVVFDRFTLENANSVVFAKSGAGKSFLVKLEAFRYFMFGTEIIIIDPENEYQVLCQAVGGEYISFGFNTDVRINPFDLSTAFEPGENELSMKILSLHSLFKIMMGELSPTEEATLDQAIVLTYRQKGITPDPATQKKEPPLLEDLYKTLIGMERQDAAGLAARLEKYVKGSFRGLFDQPSNVTLRNPFTVFSIRDLEDALRPIAMFIILDHIWTQVRRDFKKRLLIVDEAWYMMRYPDSAAFMYAMAKRARKYYLGISTISQDVDDFLTTDHGRAIVNNSSIQILLKQSTSAIGRVAETFYLSEGERYLLLSADVGQGLFFAGPNHVAIRVIASPEEYALITTNPQEILKRKNQTTNEITRATNPTPISGGMSTIPHLNSSSTSEKDAEKIDPKEAMQKLSNLEISRLEAKIDDLGNALKDPQYKETYKKAFGTDKKLLPSKVDRAKNDLRKEIINRYHQGAWSESPPIFIEPSQQELGRLSDRELQSTIEQSRHDLINEPSTQKDNIKSRIGALERQKNLRMTKGKWTIKEQ